jgi:hypothetical protein
MAEPANMMKSREQGLRKRGCICQATTSGSKISKWAQDHCDGYFRVVVAISKDRTHRKVDDCFPVDRWRMRIEAFDGARFRAVQVPV